METGLQTRSDGAGDLREFRLLLRQRTARYFQDRSPGADWRGWAKLVAGLALYLGSWALIVVAPIGLGEGLVLWLLNGLAQAFLLANVGHDAVHRAFTRNKAIDTRLAHVMSLCAVDPMVYRFSHVGHHHGITNVGLEDDALDARGLLRLSPHHPPSPFGRWQAWLAWPVYGLAFADVAFVRDFQLARRHGLPLWPLVRNKALYLGLLLGVPLAVSSLPWWGVLLGFAIAQFAGGIGLLLLFQATHLVEGSVFPASRADAGDPVRHVLTTTTDVAPDALWLKLVGGGLNTHVAHHLFPGVCHVHYPALTRIIAETARDTGLPYHVQPRFGRALASHHRLLESLG